VSVAKRARSVVLTLGGILGGLCLLAAVASVVLGVKPLVFTSGSMSPTIPAGSVAFARSVDASDLKTGDVVSVFTDDGARVTHRVVTVNGTGSERILVLKGDANSTPDAETYPVTSADRVIWSIADVGYGISFLGSPLGLFLLGAGAVGVLVLGFWPQRRTDDSSPTRPPGDRSGTRQLRRSRRKRRAAMMAVPAAVAVVAATAVPTEAAYADTTVLASGSLAGYVLPNPGALPTSSNCSASNGALGSTITLRWTGVAPDPAPRPQLADYDYELRFLDRNNNNALLSTVTVAHSGAAGAQQTYQSSANTLSGLLGLNLLSQNRVTTQIVAHLKNTSWYSLTPVSISWTVTTALGIATFTCNA
jgi:signal peptidase I